MEPSSPAPDVDAARDAEDAEADASSAFRFGIAFGALGGLILVAVAVVVALGLTGGDDDVRLAVSELVPAPAAPVVDEAPTTRFERLVATDAASLSGITLDPPTAERLGLRIVSNGFDNQSPPNATSTFRFPLPGQTPRSSLIREFFASGFIVGRAQSYLPADGSLGRLGIVAWAFDDTEGARRAFRAYRDLTGKPVAPSGFAPIATLVGDPGQGTSELLWVHGRVLLRATYSVPPGEGLLRFASTARDAVAREVDARSGAFDDEPAPAPTLATARTLAERLQVLRVPDLELPGGLATFVEDSPFGSTFLDIARGGVSTTPLEHRLEELGFRGGQTQLIEVGLRRTGRYALTALAFADEAAARAALAEIRRASATRAQPTGIFPGAFSVGGPDRAAYVDVFWQRGPLVLQAGMYAPRAAPLVPDVRDRLARLLDGRATGWTPV